MKIGKIREGQNRQAYYQNTKQRNKISDQGKWGQV